jgi:HD-GYP domain-containing protein (c-di-GMP phosphodiesterase class II)
MEMKNTYIDFNSFINSISLSLDLAEACALRDRQKKVNFDVSLPGFNVQSHNFANHSKKTALASLYIANKLGYDDNRLKNLYIAACSHDIGAIEAFTESHQESNFIY